MKTLKVAGQTLLALFLLVASVPLLAQGDIDLENEDNRIAYSIGANIGQNLVAQQIVDGIELNAFIVGMVDAISGEPQMEQAEMMAALQSYMQAQADAAAEALNENLAGVKPS